MQYDEDVGVAAKSQAPNPFSEKKKKRNSASQCENAIC
jgi:hypothetical protein